MSGPRRPRNLDGYVSKAVAAENLRQFADAIERQPSPLVKWNINVWYWNPEWSKASDTSKGAPL